MNSVAYKNFADGVLVLVLVWVHLHIIVSSIKLDLDSQASRDGRLYSISKWRPTTQTNNASSAPQKSMQT